MGDELATLMDLFHSIKKAGRSATLTLSTKGGKATIVKLEFELNDAKPSSSSTSSVSSPSLPGCQAANAAAAGDRHRHRGSAARRAKIATDVLALGATLTHHTSTKHPS